MADSAPSSAEDKAVTAKPIEKVGKSWFSPIPWLTFFLALFYAQGRAFHLGYLRHMGLDESQFPVSTTDAYWFAFNGWAVICGQGPLALYQAYSGILWQTISTAISIVLFAALLKVAQKKQWRVRLPERLKPLLEKAKTATDPIVAGAGFSLVTWLAIPGILIAATFFIGILFAFLVLTFIPLGRWEASSECDLAAARSPLVRYVGDERASADGKTTPTARLLQCSTEFCALIRDGEAFAIPRSSVQWVGGVPIEPPDDNKKHAKQPVPVAQRLCYKPASKPEHAPTTVNPSNPLVAVARKPGSDG